MKLRLQEDDIRKLLKTIIFVSASISVFGIAQIISTYFGIDLRPEFTNPGRVAAHSGYEAVTRAFRQSMATFTEPRQLGCYLLTGVFICIFCLNQGIKLYRRKFTLAILFGVILFGIFSTLSKSAILLFFAIFVYSYIPRLGSFSTDLLKNKLFITSFSTVVVLIILYISPLGALIRQRMEIESGTNMYYHFINLNEKSFGWFAYVGGQRMGFEAILEHPITGVGLNNLEDYFLSKFGWVIGSRGCYGPVNFVAQTGLLGAVGLGVFMLGFLKVIFKNKAIKQSDYLNILDFTQFLVVMSFMITFGSGLFSLTSMFFWSNIALAGLILNSITMKEN